MITIKTLVAIGSLFLLCSAATAHPDHDSGPISRAEAIARADKVVAFLSETNKLPPSWQKRQLREAVQRDHASGTIWVVSYGNSAISDPTRATVYVLFNESGGYISTTYDPKLR